jgi:plastocyanin
VIYANEIAASVTAEQISGASVVPGGGFPYGSILVMEVYRTERDEADQVLLDENGRYVRGELFGLFVMRKEPGFGLKYGGHRNGEWEYVAYRPDGTVLTPTERTDACAACHMEAGLGNDYAFGWPRAFGIEFPEAGENEINIVDYRFTPNVITVTVGTEVTWTNNDVVFHTVTQTDGSFSATLRQAASAGFTFEEATTFQYICAIHPQMSGEIRVVEP